MTVQLRFAENLIRRHPERAAAVVERVSPDDALGLLSRFDASAVSGVLAHVSPLVASTLLERIEVGRVAAVLNILPLDTATRLARGLSDERRELIVSRMSARRAHTLNANLRFPEHSVGALMDADVQAVAEDLKASQAFKQLRQGSQTFHYNIYVVNRSHTLVGALNLRELFLARPGVRLVDLMVSDPFRLQANADRAALVAHPGWKVVHSLPVVDAEGVFVGAVRYATLRRVEAELFGRRRADGETGDALGGLFAAGATGLLDALTRGGRRSSGGG